MSSSNVFSSVEEAIKELKLDKRHKWEEWNGELSYPCWFTRPCSGCRGGCSECGYTGKRRDVHPMPAFMPDGSIVRIITNYPQSLGTYERVTNRTYAGKTKNIERNTQTESSY